ncbi:MAG: response regulator [Myxococcota bacterium]
MKKVLVIDDSATVRMSVTVALEGFEVLQASNGLEGAELLESRSDIDLAFCDVNMPKMNGLEMLERVQGQVETPIVMLTTEGQPEMVRKAKRLGAKGWVVKPFDARQLLAAARKLAS